MDTNDNVRIAALTIAADAERAAAMALHVLDSRSIRKLIDPGGASLSHWKTVATALVFDHPGWDDLLKRQLDAAVLTALGSSDVRRLRSRSQLDPSVRSLCWPSGATLVRPAGCRRRQR